jgi:hypothetical protein
MSIHAPARARLVLAAQQRRLGATSLVRGLAAAAVLLAADVHFDLWYAQGFRDVPTIGPLFLLNAVAGLAIALVLLCWRHWLPALAAAGFGAATLVAFYLSVTVGIFGFKEVPTGEPQLLAETAEYAAFVLGGLAVWMSWQHSRQN